MNVEPVKCPSCGARETEVRIDTFGHGKDQRSKATCLLCYHQFTPPSLRERIRREDSAS